MKIIRLTAENIKRLTAVEIKPTGELVSIGGKNGAGKSSVLDSIAYALGGKSLIPSQPIRKGMETAQVEVDLGEYVVRRKFRLEESGKVSSSLAVFSKDGAKYPSPQTLLDSILGKLTFDPLAFAESPRGSQEETLRRLAGLDFSQHDFDRQVAYDRRTELNREFSKKSSTLEDIPFTPRIPETEMSIGELTAKLSDVDAEVARVGKMETSIFQASTQITSAENLVRDAETRVKELEADLAKWKKEQKEREKTASQLVKQHKELVAQHEKEQKKLPDRNAIIDEMREVERTNALIRRNKERAALKEQVEQLAQAVDDETATLRAMDEEKAEAIRNADYPIKGLGIGDGVEFNGIPFEQLSTAERLRISVSIGLALNPTLKVLLIREGSALDNESRQLIAEMAEEADAQVWLERVTENGEGVAFFIEEGSLGQ